MKKIVCAVIFIFMLLPLCVQGAGAGFEYYLCAESSSNAMSLNKSDVVAAQFSAVKPFTAVGFNCPSYGNNKGSLTLSLFRFDKSYDYSLSGAPIAEHEFVDFKDNANVEFEFDTPLPAGEYLLCAYNAHDEMGDPGVGVWYTSAHESQRMYKNGSYNSVYSLVLHIVYTEKPEDKPYGIPSAPVFTGENAAPFKAAVFDFSDISPEMLARFGSAVSDASCELKDGLLAVALSKSIDPWVFLDLNDLGITVAEYPVAAFCFRLGEGCPNKGGQLFFATDSYRSFAEAGSFKYSYKKTDDFQKLIIDISANANAGGTLTSLRWDIFTETDAKAKIDVKYIAFFSSYEAAEAFDGDFSKFNDEGGNEYENPDCPANEKVKATSMIERKEKSLSEGRRELWCYTSPDGLHFKKAFKMTDSSVPNGGIFDSMNVAFYDKIKGKYVAYVRGLHDGPGRGTAGGLRDIRYIESDDFRVWSAPVNLCFGNSDDVELYTNNVSRYYRAPHVFVGFPTRYTERHWLVKNFDYLGGQKNAQERRKAAAMLGEREGCVITDGLFMCSHDGLNFHKFDEALFTPGPEHDYNWVYGDCYPAYGMIETKRPYPYGTTELSMYLFEGHLRVNPQRLYRYVIRLDGFASYHADYKKKTVTTKPLMFEGDTLTLNFSTSGRGFIYVRVLDFYGKPIDGYTSHEIFGDAYDRPVVFPGSFELSRIQGMPIRLEFTMSDADIYSMNFTKEKE